MITGDRDGIIIAICIQLAVFTLIVFFKIWIILIFYVLYHIFYSIFTSLESSQNEFKLDHFKNLILIPLPVEVKWEMNSDMVITPKEKKFGWLPISIRWYGTCINAGYFTDEVDKILMRRNLNVINNDGVIDGCYSSQDSNFDLITQKELNNRFKNFLIDIVKALKNKEVK